MYLQFAPPAKKLQSASSMPHFGRDRPHVFPTSTARDGQKQAVPPLNFNKFHSQVEVQLLQTQADRAYPSEKYKSDNLADDLLELQKRLRNMTPDGQGSQPPNDNHTKHRILSRHFEKSDRHQHQSNLRESSSAHKLVPDYQQTSHNEYFPTRNTKDPLTEQKQETKFNTNSRLEHKTGKELLTMLNIPSSSTLSQQPNKIVSPPRDEVYRLRDELYRFQEESQKQQQVMRRKEQHQHRLTEENRRLQEEVKRYQDDMSFNNRRMDFLLKQNEHMAREAEVVNGNKAILQQRLEVVEKKLLDAQSVLQEAVDYERQIKRLKENLLTLEIEVEEKNAQINFLTKKVLSVQEKQREDTEVDVTRYEQTIESLRRQIRQLSQRPQHNTQHMKSGEFNEILRDHITEIQKLKDDVAVKQEQLRILREDMSVQKFKIDNFRNELETERLRAMAEKKNIQVQHDIVNQNNLNEIGSLKKLIFAIEEKYRISVNDNLRKDDFVKCHILGKTKNEYDRQDIEVFFKAYEAEVPKQSLRNTLMKELIQIKELQERIVQLETALAASQSSRRLSDLSDPASK